MKLRDFQKITGKRLTLKEKIGFVVLKHKIKKTQKKEKGTGNGQLSLIMGIAGVAFMIGGLFVPPLLIPSLIAGIIAVVVGSSAKKSNPNDKKAQAGKLLGWITLGLIAILAILVAIILASWDWWE